MVVEAMRIHVRALMHTLDSDLEAGVRPGGELHLHGSLGYTLLTR
jgi:hypothetical protein